MGKNKRKYAFGFSGKVSEKSKYEIPVSKASLFDLYPYFSFRYYHIDHNRFTHKGFSENDFNNFFERIHKMSQFTWKEIFTTHRSFFHAHEVNWAQTTQGRGFSHLSRVLQDHPVHQFELFKQCRVFGFFNQNNVFKIVWIDRYHEIYPYD